MLPIYTQLLSYFPSGYVIADITPCGKFAILNERWESSTKNLFFLGTCTQQRDRRAASSFIHGFRYSVRSLGQLIEHERHQVPLPVKTFNQIHLTDFTDFLIGES